MTKLNDRQALFVKEYLVDLNATQAAIRAGYSKKTAGQQGERLLKNVEIAKAIQQGMAEREKKVAVDAEYVVNKLHEIAEMDVLDIMNDDMSFKPISQWPKVWRQYLSGIDISELITGVGDEVSLRILKKIKWPDKVKNLELLGRHLGIFNDKLNVHASVQSGVLVVPADQSEEEWEKGE